SAQFPSTALSFFPSTGRPHYPSTGFAPDFPGSTGRSLPPDQRSLIPSTGPLIPSQPGRYSRQPRRSIPANSLDSRQPAASFPSTGRSFPSTGRSFPSTGRSFRSTGRSFPFNRPFIPVKRPLIPSTGLAPIPVVNAVRSFRQPVAHSLPSNSAISWLIPLKRSLIPSTVAHYIRSTGRSFRSKPAAVHSRSNGPLITPSPGRSSRFSVQTPVAHFRQPSLDFPVQPRPLIPRNPPSPDFSRRSTGLLIPVNRRPPHSRQPAAHSPPPSTWPAHVSCSSTGRLIPGQTASLIPVKPGSLLPVNRSLNFRSKPGRSFPGQPGDRLEFPFKTVRPTVTVNGAAHSASQPPPFSASKPVASIPVSTARSIPSPDPLIPVKPAASILFPVSTGRHFPVSLIFPFNAPRSFPVQPAGLTAQSPRVCQPVVFPVNRPLISRSTGPAHFPVQRRDRSLPCQPARSFPFNPAAHFPPVNRFAHSRKPQPAVPLILPCQPAAHSRQSGAAHSRLNRPLIWSRSTGRSFPGQPPRSFPFNRPLIPVQPALIPVQPVRLIPVNRPPHSRQPGRFIPVNGPHSRQPGSAHSLQRSLISRQRSPLHFPVKPAAHSRQPVRSFPVNGRSSPIYQPVAHSRSKPALIPGSNRGRSFSPSTGAFDHYRFNRPLHSQLQPGRSFPFNGPRSFPSNLVAHSHQLTVAIIPVNRFNQAVHSRQPERSIDTIQHRFAHFPGQPAAPFPRHRSLIPFNGRSFPSTGPLIFIPVNRSLMFPSTGRPFFIPVNLLVAHSRSTGPAQFLRVQTGHTGSVRSTRPASIFPGQPVSALLIPRSTRCELSLDLDYPVSTPSPRFPILNRSSFPSTGAAPFRVQPAHASEFSRPTGPCALIPVLQPAALFPLFRSFPRRQPGRSFPSTGPAHSFPPNLAAPSFPCQRPLIPVSTGRSYPRAYGRFISRPH
ncbi:hypothetical protein C7M84_017191, partial [Penaeus vannamei]